MRAMWTLLLRNFLRPRATLTALPRWFERKGCVMLPVAFFPRKLLAIWICNGLRRFGGDLSPWVRLWFPLALLASLPGLPWGRVVVALHGGPGSILTRRRFCIKIGCPALSVAHVVCLAEVAAEEALRREKKDAAYNDVCFRAAVREASKG